MKNCCSYFQNQECEYFPCHKTASEAFNCLFCYCPLYALGDKCGGNYTYTDGGIKDCSNCLIPHSVNGYAYIHSKFQELADLARQNHAGKGEAAGQQNNLRTDAAAEGIKSQRP